MARVVRAIGRPRAGDAAVAPHSTGRGSLCSGHERILEDQAGSAPGRSGRASSSSATSPSTSSSRRPAARAGGPTSRAASSIRQGGSAANTARWLARLGAPSTLVCAVGRDAAGRALVAALEADGVVVRAVRVAGVAHRPDRRPRRARRGALVRRRPGRGAAPAPEDVRPAWFERAAVVHLPAYSLLGEPLGRAGLAATATGRAAGALVSVDLRRRPAPRRRPRCRVRAPRSRRARTSSSRRRGRPPRSSADRDAVGPARLAPVVVVKRGARGATVHRPRRRGPASTFATRPIPWRPTPRAPATHSTPASSSAGSRPARRDRRRLRAPTGRGRRQPGGGTPPRRDAAGARARLEVGGEPVEDRAPCGPCGGRVGRPIAYMCDSSG